MAELFLGCHQALSLEYPQGRRKWPWVKKWSTKMAPWYMEPKTITCVNQLLNFEPHPSSRFGGGFQGEKENPPSHFGVPDIFKGATYPKGGFFFQHPPGLPFVLRVIPCASYREQLGDSIGNELGKAIQPNVNPGLINPWLINRGCPLLVGIHHFWREHTPPIIKQIMVFQGNPT